MRQGSEWWNACEAKTLNSHRQRNAWLIMVQIIRANIYWLLALYLQNRYNRLFIHISYMRLESVITSEKQDCNKWWAHNHLVWQWKTSEFHQIGLAPDGGHQMWFCSLTAMPRIDRWIIKVSVKKSLQKMCIFCCSCAVLSLASMSHTDMTIKAIKFAIAHAI